MKLDFNNKSWNEWKGLVDPDFKYQCVGFVKGTQGQQGFKIGAYGNGRDVTKNLINNYGYIDLKGGFQPGAVVSFKSSSSVGHVGVIDKCDSSYVYITEGNYDGKSTGNYRNEYKMKVADFKKYCGGIVGTCIHPNLYQESKKWIVTLAKDCADGGVVGCYSDSACSTKMGNIKPCNYGGLTYDVLADNTSNGGKRVKIDTDSFGVCWITITTHGGEKLKGRDLKQV